MARFPFKEGDRIVVCSDNRFKDWNGKTGIIQHIKRSYYGRISKIKIKWDGDGATCPSSNPFALIFTEWIPDEVIPSTVRRLMRPASVCHNCVHRLARLTEGNCKNRHFVWATGSIQKWKKKLQNDPRQLS